jgi:hypothetical protein
VTHQPELMRRLRGQVLYLVKGRVHAFESADHPGSGSSIDVRLHTFLTGEPIDGTENRV